MKRPEPTLQAWEAYLLAQHPKEIDLGLHRIEALAERLELNRFDCPVITVAGTNGKGSTVACLEAFYLKAGLSVGVYTSPHLLSFTERIKINGALVSEARLVEALDWLFDKTTTSLTFFEYTTLAALKIFKDEGVSRLVLEVGMGGRLDATNIVDANVAIITTVDFDHQDYLGDTLEEIGYEKAGIMRKGAVAIYGDLTPPKSVLEHARQTGTTLKALGESYLIAPVDVAIHNALQPFLLTLPNQSVLALDEPRLNPKSIAAALVALDALGDLNRLSADEVTSVVRHAGLLGRLSSIVHHGVEWILDVAHNAQSVRHLRLHLEQVRNNRRIIALFSALKDKEIDKMVAKMSDVVDEWYISPLDSTRAASLDRLTLAIEAHTTQPIHQFISPLEAIKKVDLDVENDHLVVVFGSFLMVGSALHYLNANLKESS